MAFSHEVVPASFGTSEVAVLVHMNIMIPVIVPQLACAATADQLWCRHVEAFRGAGVAAICEERVDGAPIVRFVGKRIVFLWFVLWKEVAAHLRKIEVVA